MTKRFVGFGPNVFVKEEAQENKVGALFIPDSLDADFTYGTVVSVSGGYYSQSGNYIGNNIIEGQRVMFPKISGSKVMFNGEKLIRVFVNDIVAVEVEE